MSGKSFKVKTADGETWEWDIHTANDDDDETKEQLIKDEEVEWNKPALVTLVVGLILWLVFELMNFVFNTILIK